jgi:hypothetical protein
MLVSTRFQVGGVIREPQVEPAARRHLNFDPTFCRTGPDHYDLTHIMD